MLVNIKNKSKMELICWGVLIFQLLFIAYVNFFKIPDTLDNDAAKLFLHAIEMWNNKKIFLPNWRNMTTLELDCAALLAMPIYGISHNIYISFAVANIVIIFAYILILSLILENMSADEMTRVITYIIILIPYSFGQLLYFNMMFFAGSHYGIKVLVPLMYIEVMTAENIRIREKIIGVASLLLTLIMGISTGPYVLVTAVAPLCFAYCVCELINIRKFKELVSTKTFYVVSSGIMAVLGELICLKKHVNTSGNSITLISGGEIPAAFASKLKSFFEVTGGFAYERTSILSREGIVLSFKYAFALFMLISIVAGFIDVFKNKKLNNVYIYLCIFIAVNMLILLFTDSFGVARYLLVALVPSFILMTSFWSQYIERIEDERINTISKCALLALIFVELIFSDYQVITKQSFPYFAHEDSKYRQIVELLEKEPEEHVFVMNDNGQPEVYRIYGLNGNKEYLVYLTETNTIEVHDYYWSDDYYQWLNEEFLLVGCDSNTSIEMMPEEIQERSEVIGHVQNYSIYRIKAK